MIFLDTSAIYALADTADPNHELAVKRFRNVLKADEEFLVHNYVLVESAALLQRRLGHDSARRFLQEANAFQVHWIGDEDHGRAMALFEERSRRRLSLVDCASFAVMRLYGVDTALAFDADFQAEGFTVYGNTKE